MQKWVRPVGRLLAVVALLALTQLPGDSVVGGVAGRDFARCIHSCNAVKTACNNQCSADCSALYPGTPNKTLRNACIDACRATCLANDDECKLMCQAVKNPPTTEAP
jgi:hypothetical protein